jgi:GNAT superfamily N-acetyltransferase
MVLTDSETALVLENVEARHLQQQVQAYGQMTQREGVRTIAVPGGIAAVTDPAFGRKLNHVTGLGMGAPVTSEPVAMLEQTYFRNGLAVEIDLCPHAHPSALAVLAERGYAANAFSNTYARRLTDEDLDFVPDAAIEVVTDRAAIDKSFLEYCIAGFSVQATRRSPELLEALARIAAARADTTLFLAKSGADIAGSAGMSVFESPMGKIAHLYIASTLEAFRGRGIQSALLRARFAAARRVGCVMACLAARPSNSSARNAERSGFGLAYTKSTFVKARP